MSNEEVLRIAQTALQQIKAGVSTSVYWSWGVSKLGYTVYEQMPTLMLRVSGLLHKGWVYVSLNQGSDTYEVRLMKVDRTMKKGTEPHTDVYCDQIGELIDQLIERGTCSEQEYCENAMKDSKRKLA